MSIPPSIPRNPSVKKVIHRVDERDDRIDHNAAPEVPPQQTYRAPPSTAPRSSSQPSYSQEPQTAPRFVGAWLFAQVMISHHSTFSREA